MAAASGSNYNDAEKRLNDLMSEYLVMKQIERKNMIADWNPAIRKRIYALQVLQKDTIKLDAEFHRSVYEMEQKFQEKPDEIFKKRSEIINGKYEPTDSECQLSDVELEKLVPTEGQDIPTGVPDFWLTVLKNVAETRSMIEDTDEDVLKHLVDVRAFSKPMPNLSFQLEFHFEPNEYFQNSVLTKTYLMKCVPDEDDPFAFEGPEIYKAIGCEIMWNAGKNVTEKTENRGSTSRLFKSDSFFNFFNPPELRIDESENDNNTEEYLESDFEVGHYLKERVIPRAVLYFIGMIDDDISDEDDDNESTYHAESYLGDEDD